MINLSTTILNVGLSALILNFILWVLSFSITSHHSSFLLYFLSAEDKLIRPAADHKIKQREKFFHDEI